MRKPRRKRIQVKLQEEIFIAFPQRSFVIEKLNNSDYGDDGYRLIIWDLSGEHKQIYDIRECNKKFIPGFVDEIFGMLIKIVEN